MTWNAKKRSKNLKVSLPLKQALGEKLSQQIAKREQDLMGPIQKKVQKAIATVAKRAGISSVVDSSAMLYGGKDLTSDVIAEVAK